MTKHLFTGGARSGKSSAAENLASTHDPELVTYLATAKPLPDDAEWQNRILQHQQRRPSEWKTIETLDICGPLTKARETEFILIDCLTLWLTGIFDSNNFWDVSPTSSHGVNQLAEIRNEITKFIDVLSSTKANVAIVTNEIGLGIVPADEHSRCFRDELGRLNIAVANTCNQVTMCVSGQLLKLK